MERQQEKGVRIGDEFVVIDRMKSEVLNSLNNALIDLKHSTRKAIYIAAVIQYFAIVGSIWAIFHYTHFLIK